MNTILIKLADLLTAGDYSEHRTKLAEAYATTRSDVSTIRHLRGRVRDLNDALAGINQRASEAYGTVPFTTIAGVQSYRHGLETETALTYDAVKFPKTGWRVETNDDDDTLKFLRYGQHRFTLDGNRVHYPDTAKRLDGSTYGGSVVTIPDALTEA